MGARVNAGRKRAMETLGEGPVGFWLDVADMLRASSWPHVALTRMWKGGGCKIGGNLCGFAVEGASLGVDPGILAFPCATTLAKSLV